jgi:hypothetical protein
MKQYIQKPAINIYHKPSIYLKSIKKYSLLLNMEEGLGDRLKNIGKTILTVGLSEKTIQEMFTKKKYLESKIYSRCIRSYFMR